MIHRKKRKMILSPRKTLKFILLAFVAAPIAIRLIDKELFEIIIVGLKAETLYIVDSATGIPLKYVAASDKQKVNEYYVSLVQEEIINSFYNEGGEITVSDYALNRYLKMQGYSNNNNQSLGAYVVNENKIAVSESTEAMLDAAVLHEIGHYYDHMNDIASDDDEFKKIAAEEITRHASRYIILDNDYSYRDYQTTGDYSEYFATTFAEYILRPHYLKYAAPETYNYFKTYYDGGYTDE